MSILFFVMSLQSSMKLPAEINLKAQPYMAKSGTLHNLSATASKKWSKILHKFTNNRCSLNVEVGFLNRKTN